MVFPTLFNLNLNLSAPGLVDIIREYYKQFYANKVDNGEKMDRLLETYSLTRRNREVRDNFNRQISGSEIQFIIFLKISANKSPIPAGSTEEFYHTYKEELIPIFPQTIPKKLKRMEHSQIYSMRLSSP